MKTYEKEALEVIAEVMTKANEEVEDKLEDLFDELELGLNHEDEKNSLIAFYHKLVSDQLINQGVKPSDSPLRFLTSGTTGLLVPVVDFRGGAS